MTTPPTQPTPPKTSQSDLLKSQLEKWISQHPAEMKKRSVWNKTKKP